MNIVPVTNLPLSGSSYPLTLYAGYVGYTNECSFWGVNCDHCHEYVCPPWTVAMRNEMFHYLCVAAEMLKNKLGYPLLPTWQQEQHDLTCPIILNCKYVQKIGKRVEEKVTTSAVAYQDDLLKNATITFDLSAYNGEIQLDELIVCHAGTEIEVSVSQVVSFNQSSLTVQIPACRLVNPILYAEAPDCPIPCTRESFADEVDLKRVYADPSQGIEVLCPPSCVGCCCDKGCTIQVSSGCAAIVDGECGEVIIKPDDVCTKCCRQSRVRINYLAGKAEIGWQEREMLIRLAHAMMPKKPCGCHKANDVWTRDRKENEQGFYTPWGGTDGAVTVWNWANENMAVTAGII